jgi:hypothetical protein
VVLLVLKDEQNDLRFLTHPALHTVVSGDDFTYIQSLLKDFLERVKREPADLFRQLSSLGVGPLVMHDVGSDLANNSSLLKIASSFVELQ